MDIKKGFSFYRWKGLTPYKCHVVSIVKDYDNDIDLVVCKWYGKHKQWWHYQVVELSSLKDSFEYGKFTKNRKRSS